jgi:hypothetical protein
LFENIGFSSDANGIFKIGIEERLPNPSSTINFVIKSFQEDSNINNRATLSSGLLYTNSQILPSSNIYPNDIKITILVSNNS